MSRIVLVHGAFHNASCWDTLVPLLKAQGHTVTAIDLPGHGSDATPLGTVTLDAYATKVAQELATSSEPTVLIGHSMGGMVVTQAADMHLAAGHNLDQLIYLAAFVPRDGQSLVDLAGQPEGAGDMVQANVQVDGEPPIGVMPADKAVAAFYADCTPEVAATAVAALQQQPILAFVLPAHITNDRELHRSYISTTKDNALPPALQKKMAKDSNITEFVEISSDHSPFLSHPEELAEILRDLID